MIKGAILLFSLFLGCCFAQNATDNASRWHDHPGAAPVLFEKAGHFDAAVNSTAQTVPVCYSCFFENAGILPDKKLIPYFQSVSASKDPLISGDARFIVWRVTGKKDCGALDAYRSVTGAADRRLTANANFGFSAWECDQSGSVALEQAFAQGLFRDFPHQAFGDLHPRFE